MKGQVMALVVAIGIGVAMLTIGASMFDVVTSEVEATTNSTSTLNSLIIIGDMIPLFTIITILCVVMFTMLRVLSGGVDDDTEPEKAEPEKPLTQLFGSPMQTERTVVKTSYKDRMRIDKKR